MKKMRKLIISALLFITALIVSVNNVNAETSARMTLSGQTQANVDESFSIQVIVDRITGAPILNIGGTIESDDESCIKFESVENTDPFTASNKNRFAYSNMMGSAADVHPVNLNFKAGSNTCSTTVRVTGGELSFIDSTKIRTTAELTINVVVPSPKSTDNTLKSLTPSKGTLDPTFDPSTTEYNMDAEAGDTSVDFTAVPNDPNAHIKSGATCNLTSNTTNCKIVVEAEDGSEKTYTVTVKKLSSGNTPQNPDDPTNPDNPDDPSDPSDPTNPDNPDEPTDPSEQKSSDATLKSLDVSGFTLKPTFNKNVTSYEITVNNNITSLDVTAIPTDPNASVKIQGNSNWKVGVNPIVITVTAEDGTTKTYIVNVTRKALGGESNNASAPKDSDNYLSDIEVTNGKLSPDFSREVTEYNITVPYSVTKLDLEPIKSSDKATVQVSGNSNFQVGKINVVTIKVTAEDGSVRVYNINVTRSSKEADNKLDNIVINDGEIDPDFDPDINRYVVEVGPNVKDLNINAIPHNPNSKVEVIGGEDLKEGNNKVRVIVTDENGLSQVYYLNVYKKGAKKFLGLTLGGWLALLGGLLLLGLLLFIIFALLKKKKEPEEKEENKSPVIEFKPEFNFGSKNGTDDDVVEKGGVLNQYTGNGAPQQEPPKAIPEASASVRDVRADEVYDPYDDVVTKDELFDAINEAKATKDVDKLKMLYEQEMLNRRKAELKAKEDNDHRYKG